MRVALPLLVLVIPGGIVAGVVVGSWKLWGRGEHRRAVLISSLPYLLLLPLVVVGVVWDSL